MIRQSFTNLRADARGAAVIELALIAPILALTVIGVVDMSNAYSRKLALEQGAHRAIEKIMQTTDVDTVEDTLANEALCQVNGLNTNGTCKTSPITLSDVTITWRLECYDAGGTMTAQTSTSTTTFDSYVCGTGTVKEARYVEIALTDKYTPMFPVHFASFTSGDGTYHLSATAGMRTE
ncbi:MAG: TadE/TadG family type IV pilus assembly protein [Sphingomicrobium sp.]